MKLPKSIRLFFLLLSVFAILIAVAPAQAQSKSVVVPRRDVDITILKNGDVQVNETWRTQFIGGPFTFAFRGVALDKVVSVGNFKVSEGRLAYQQNSSGAANTYQVYQDSGQQFVKWFFPPTTNETRTFNIQYTLVGALRIYTGGDQFWWKIIEADRSYTIENSTITVHLPASFPTDQIKAAVTTGTGTATVRDGQTVQFTASNLGNGDELEIRVQFPHGVVTAAPPPWQAAADQQAAMQAQIDQYKPVLNLIFIVIGFLILLVGPLLLYLLWFMKGRDAPTQVVAQTSAPPDDFPPGIVGTLIDERADMKDIIASIVDLARRGIIKMTEKDTPGLLGIGTNRDYAFELVGDTSNLRKYEQTLIRHIFSGSTTRDLSDLKEQFYTAIPTLKSEMYDEVTKLGFFAGNPNTTRLKYAGLGVAALFVLGGCGVLVWIMLSAYAEAAICPAIALIVSSIGLIAISPFMPHRTPKGATERAKWMAFKRYLESIEKFTKLDQAKDLFDKYLPYTISFGLEKSWVQKFAAVGTPAPTWYEMYPPMGYGYPRQGGYSTGGAGGLSGGGIPSGGQMPSLDQAAGGAFTSLDSMTSGLFSMLDSTASVLTSAPSSSGGGGGGWSGGGGGGGGVGGGGSSGFG